MQWYERLYEYCQFCIGCKNAFGVGVWMNVNVGGFFNVGGKAMDII